MAKLAAKNIVFKIDDNGDVERTFDSADLVSLEIPLAKDKVDITGMGDSVHNFLDGQLVADFTLRGYMTTDALTGTHTVLAPLAANADNQSQVTVQVGQNAAPTTGDPEFTGVYNLTSYRLAFEMGKAIQFVAQFSAADDSGYSWGSMS